jgi:hypothetical protein
MQWILQWLRSIAPASDSQFDFGPDQDDDLRFKRPYFLLTLSAQHDASPGENTQNQPKLALHERILTAVAKRNVVVKGQDEPKLTFHERILTAVAQRHQEGQPPFTDVFIMSHGWHRNFFGAVAAYDRLVGRLLLLRHSRRLPLLPSLPDANEHEEAARQEQAGKNFHPLFICLHWHSDPGQDRWDDAQGRRHKDSFFDNARRMFTYPPRGYAEFLRDFECLFELMSQMSTPGKDAFSDTQIEVRAPHVTRCLIDKDPADPTKDKYQLQAAPNASLAEKIAVLWTCYYESEPRGMLTIPIYPSRQPLRPSWGSSSVSWA